ncbi:hypothetical protein HMPREF3173_21640 [Pseudomonas sp. HMSC08G10]|jgi:hypothetical protein|uniref:hypothetical protein n=1 Tax=Pseudomonas sp. HMSC08G10 TaxID=1581141 RepID=UPI0008A42548|nr:hypothetical protein [Pseudomonas sp. HMSC08G10]OFS69947.1 hypothetical protein HMPREF3173_21640 [Pseudomonas sp. HMSC08G10]
MYNYRQQGTLFSWIRKSSPEDRHWARAYLLRKGLPIQADAFEPSSLDPFFPDDALHREIDSQLRNAWRQRKARRKLSGRKAYNFVLSHSAKRKLDQIAEAMFSSITDALNNVIDHEHRRIEEHAQKLKELKKEEIRLKKLSKSLQTITHVTQTLNATERALQLQTMKLVLAQLRLDNPYAQHAPSDALKEEALEKFRSAWQEITTSMGLLALGLPTRIPDLETVWQKVMSESPDNSEETSRALL